MSEDLVGETARGWLALGAGSGAHVRRLVLTDVDGVITEGEGSAADLDVLGRLRELNARALRDPCVPALALCTGRQAPYVELMAQMVGAFLPCIFEHGAGLYFPTTFRYAFDAQLGPDYAGRLAHLRGALEGPLLRTGRAFVQPGKEATMSLYPLGGLSVDELIQAVRPILPTEFGLAANVHGVEIRPHGIDKGLGARRISEALGIPLHDMAGVGDSDPDLSYLRVVGFSAAPANATPGVKEGVTYVATGGFGQGLLEILGGIEDANRRSAPQLTDS